MQCLFGSIFHPVTIDLAWLTPSIVAQARTIYEERAFDHLPFLADVLEAARWDNPNIQDHCRGPGPHVRGCWVIDLLLGKS